MADKEIQLGDRVKDRISGLVGIVTAKSEYMNGCRRFGVQPEKLTKDGAVAADTWFDEPQLQLVKKSVHLAIPIGIVARSPIAQARRYAGGPARSGDRPTR